MTKAHGKWLVTYQGLSGHQIKIICAGRKEAEEFAVMVTRLNPNAHPSVMPKDSDGSS